MQTKSVVAEKNAELLRLARSKEAKKQAKKRRRDERILYAKTDKEFVLTISGKRTPIKRTMKGREATLMNKLNVLDFGSGKSKKLLKWVAFDWIIERQKNHEDTGTGVNSNSPAIDTYGKGQFHNNKDGSPNLK